MKYLLIALALCLPLIATAQETNDETNSLPLGTLDRAQILSNKWYNWRYVEYVPKSDPIEEIYNYSNPAEIKVYFGDWCKDSKKHVPAFIKTMEFSDNGNIQVTYINLNTTKKEPAEFLKGTNIELVPTFVVLSGNTELGRIVEAPKVSMEQDIADILHGRYR